MEKKKPLPELNYNPDPSAISDMMSSDVPDASQFDALAAEAGQPQKPRFETPVPTGEGPSKMDQIMAYLQPKFANAAKNLTTPLPGSYSEVGGDSKPSPVDGMINGDVFPSGSPFGMHDDRPPVDPDLSNAAAMGTSAGVSKDTIPSDDDAARSAAVQEFIAKQRGPASADSSSASPNYGYKSDRNDDALVAAIQARREDEAHNNLGRAFNTASAAIGHQKLDNSFYDTLDKQSGQHVTDIDTLRKGQAGESDFAQKQKLEDPTAPENQAFRSSLFAAWPELKGMPGIDNITLANPGPFEKMADAHQRAEATKAANESNRMMKQAQMDALGQERNRKEADMTASKLRGDKEYQAALAGEDSAKNALDSLDLARTNPIAFGSKAIETARSIVGGGRINVQEIQQLGGSQAIMDRIEQMAQTAKSGTITPANYQFYKQLIQLSLKNAQEHKAKAIDTYVNAYARRNNKPHDEAYTDLIGKPPEAPGAGQQSAGTDEEAVAWAKDPSSPKWTKEKADKILSLHGLK